MKVLICFSLFLHALALAHNDKAPWKGFSRPEIISSGFSSQFPSLPLAGSIHTNPKGWSGDYWSAKLGGINFRWNASVKIGYNLDSPSRHRALEMSLEELKTLAPSEKFDLFLGRYDYPLVKEADELASPTASTWAGICHGWAPATLYHNEPTPKVMINPDGIEIPFGSGDIKALLSYYYAFYHKAQVDQVGLRCYFGQWLGGGRACKEDLNAGAFHIILANKIGLQKEGFIMDVDRWRQVWNHPAVSYHSEILSDNLPVSEKAATTAVKEVLIRTKVTHADGSKPTWEPLFGTEHQKEDIQTYDYRIEINQNQEIVGGSWVSDNRPDFIWSMPKVEKFSRDLAEISQLLND